MKKFLSGTLLTVLTFAACSPSARAQQCPSVQALRNYRPPEASRVYAVDGSLIADLSPERRVVVDLNEVPPTISNGFVAVEDRRFWEHDGVDFRGAARATWRNITDRKSTRLNSSHSQISYAVFCLKKK